MISVLFCQPSSIYGTLAPLELDIWDKDRDALNWPGGNQAIMHPPCRSWSILHGLAKPEIGEKELAIWSVFALRKWGGVLEHPARSGLWKALDLPFPGHRSDRWGGFSLGVYQRWWGHKADKPTWLYIVPRHGAPTLPVIPFDLDYEDARSGTGVPAIRARLKTKRVASCPGLVEQRLSKRDRIATPPEFARWLVEVASRC